MYLTHHRKLCLSIVKLSRYFDKPASRAVGEVCCSSESADGRGTMAISGAANGRWKMSRSGAADGRGKIASSGAADGRGTYWAWSLWSV
ncbi:hypothetical protein DPMN_059200 [Dreissena polymorpha]|uniref:Uncharacterized protein n=1 Tax=Dreissena polymorpha TaxID=45954 RepID=A0A9D4HES7_DREPO|nr:hypothetical protein DPMN_059200 [Dreissena polymorpha]